MPYRDVVRPGGLLRVGEEFGEGRLPFLVGQEVHVILNGVPIWSFVSVGQDADSGTINRSVQCQFAVAQWSRSGRAYGGTVGRTQRYQRVLLSYVDAAEDVIQAFEAVGSQNLSKGGMYHRGILRILLGAGPMTDLDCGGHIS